MDTQQVPLITIWVVMTVLAAVTVGMRFYTRRLILHILGPEDWLILVSMILAIGACVGFIRQTFYGLGRHEWTLNAEMIMKWKLEQFYSFLFYTMSLAFAKISILFLYMRIMTQGTQRTANYVVLAIVMACNIWVFIGSFIQCIPLQALWDPEVKGTCLGLGVTLGNSIMHIITDFVIFALPLPTLAKLKLHKRQKIGLLLVFSLGFCVCLISILRLVSLSRLDGVDMPYKFSIVGYWGGVEVNLAVICACLTTLRPLIVRLFPRLLASTRTYNLDAPTTIGGTHHRHTQAAPRSFARLDGESVKSEEYIHHVSSYELEERNPKEHDML